MESVDIIPGLIFTDSQEQVIGSVAGALIGALLGGTAAFFIGEYARNKEIQKQKIFENRTILRCNDAANTQASTFIVSTLVQNEFNTATGSDISGGIINQRNDLTFQINVPEPYDTPPDDIMENLCNDDINAEWLSLRQEIKLQNSNIINFRDYYILLRTTLFTEMHTGNKASLDIPSIQSDNATIIKTLRDQDIMHNAFKERCIRIQAKLICFHKYRRSFDLKDSKSLAEHRKLVNNLYCYTPEEKTFETQLTEVRKMCDNLILNKPRATSIDS